MASVMEEQLGATIDELVARGEMNTITAWLKENIHQHGQLYKPGELLEMCCGKFDASYYTDYLVKKYSELYNL
jgi:carboxypeptidase Taq